MKRSRPTLSALVAFAGVGLVQAARVDLVHPIVQSPGRRISCYLLAAALHLVLLGAPWLLLRWLLPRRPLLLLGIQLLLVIAVLTAPMAAPPREAPAAASPQPRPSVLLLTIDTLRRDHVSAYGASPIATPNLDRIGHRGAVFEHAYAQAPLTAPSHASLLTGRLPPKHGSRYNGVPVRTDVEALAPLLKAHGYRTAAFVSSGVLTGPMSGLNRGFDRYDARFLPDLVSQQLYLLPPVTLALRLAGIRLPEQRGRVTVERARGWLRRHEQSDVPLFLWVHLYDPHIPYDPPRPYRRAADPDYEGTFTVDRASVVGIREGTLNATARDLEHGRRLYAAEVAYVDDIVAPLLSDVLQSPAPFVVAVAADHGESLGEHDYTFFHGENLFRPSMQVPLMLSGPGVREGVRVESLIRLMDLMPTLLDLVGIPVPPDLEARSLRPLLEGRSLPALPAYAEDGDRLYIAPTREGFTLAKKDLSLRTKDFTYIVRPATGRERLYALNTDPEEEHDVAPRPEYREVTQEFREQLEAITAFSTYADGSVMPSPDEAGREDLEQLGYVE